MSTVPHLLTTDLNRLEGDLRAWPAHEQPNAEVENVEEAMAVALYLYNRLMHHHQEWTGRVNGQAEPFMMERAVEFERGFHTWVAAARLLHERIRVLEEAGHSFAQALELRHAIQRCPYDGISVEELVQGARELEAGGGITLEELTDEIHRTTERSGR